MDAKEGGFIIICGSKNNTNGGSLAVWDGDSGSAETLSNAVYELNSYMFGHVPVILFDETANVGEDANEAATHDFVAASFH
jgi:hypothetical protein